MTELILFRAGRALVVTLSALTLAHLLELSPRLRRTAVTVLAMTVGYQRPGGRFWRLEHRCRPI
jgi:hypothetical protein